MTSEEKGYEIHPEHLYDFSAGVYCGVLMTEQVMKKLAKLQAKYLEDTKRLLTTHKDELYHSSWSLYYPHGKQTVIKYISQNEFNTIEDRIGYATMTHPPKHCPLVFIAKDTEEAEKMAVARDAALGNTDDI